MHSTPSWCIINTCVLHCSYLLILNFLVILHTVMCPSHFCRVRVTTTSSQSHLNFFRISVITWPSQSGELSSHFESLVCKLESMLSHTKFHVFSTTFFAMKWHPTCNQTASDKFENGAQHAMKWSPIS